MSDAWGRYRNHAYGFCPSMCVSTTPMCAVGWISFKPQAIAVFG